MSSVATAPPDAPTDPLRATRQIHALGLRLGTDIVFGAGLAAALIALVFLTGSGIVPGSNTKLGGNTCVEILLVLLGVGLGIAVLLIARRGPAWGVWPVAAFAALTGLTALSVIWSIVPDLSWLAADQTLAYLCAFAGGVAIARLAPETWAAAIGGIALAATVISGYALLAKVFPGSLDSGDVLGRLNQPFAYWNATGLLAAMGLPAVVWAGSRRAASLPVRVVTIPAVAVLGAVAVLSYSRSALAAAIVALALWFVFVPLRLRAALVVVLGGVGAAVICAWALARTVLTDDLPHHEAVVSPHELAAKTSAGHTFGLVIVLVLVACALAGYGLIWCSGRRPLGAAERRRIGIVLLCLVALVPLGGVVKLAGSQRGLFGEVSHLWGTLTSTNQSVGDSAVRLGGVANSRPVYWKEGFTIASHALLKGVGALGYGTAAPRYTSDPQLARQAHSYIVQTLADLGLLGVAVSLALLLTWGRDAFRALGWSVRRRVATGGDSASALERAGLLTMLCVVVAFGVQSTIDWSWFIPGLTVPALLCAGWLAGRGPAGQPIGRAEHRRRILDQPRLPLITMAAAIAALAAAWVIWEPLRSVDSDNAASSASSLSAALGDAHAAVAQNPLALAPLEELSALQMAAREPELARATLIQSTRLQPQNPQSWQDLGIYDLNHGRPGDAFVELGRALSFNRTDYTAYLCLHQAVTATKGPLTASERSSQCDD